MLKRATRTWKTVLLMLAAVLCHASAIAQTSYDYFYMEAEKCRLAGDYSSAMELYRHCLDIAPEAPAAMHQLGVLYVYLRQDSLGLSLLQKACDKDSANPSYLETLASIYIGRHDTEKAVHVLEKMAGIQTRRVDVLSQLAGIYRSTGETDKAIYALDRIEMLEGKNAQLSLEKHSLYMSKGERDSAFAELQELCDEFPHDMNYRVLMADQYRAAGEMEKAEAIYDSVRSKDPTNINLHLSRLAYYENSGQREEYMHLRDSLLYNAATESELKVALLRTYIDEAQQDSTAADMLTQAFDSLLSKPQDDIQVLTLKAAYQIYTKTDEGKVAGTMRRILEVEPGNTLALARLLQYYAARKDYGALEEICRQGFNYHPEEPLYAYYLGITLTQQDRNREAIEAMKMGLQAKSDDTNNEVVSDLYAALGDLYYQDDMCDKAFAAYDSALVYYEDNISCLNNYAYYLSVRSERLDDAENMSYRTIKAEPDNITYLDTYAWILFMKGDYNGARIYMKKVVDPEADDKELLEKKTLQGNLIEHAGDIHMMCGDEETALRFWKLAMARKDGTCTPALAKKISKKKYIKE